MFDRFIHCKKGKYFLVSVKGIENILSHCIYYLCRLEKNSHTNKIDFLARSQFGNDLYLDSICIDYLVGISHNGNTVPKVYSLAQNYPNPFNPTTTINFGLPKAGLVKLVIYDILGRVVSTLVNEHREAGTYNIAFDASNISSGVYFYKLEAGDFSSIKKMVLVK